WTVPGIMGKKPARCFALLAVKASVPCVRPWNAPGKARKMCRFLWGFATLMAASSACAPVLTQDAFFRGLPRVFFPRRDAIRPWGRDLDVRDLHHGTRSLASPGAVLIVSSPRIFRGRKGTGAAYFAAPIRMIVVPQTGHFPFIAGLPFFSFTATALLISRFAR